MAIAYIVTNEELLLLISLTNPDREAEIHVPVLEMDEEKVQAAQDGLEKKRYISVSGEEFRVDRVMFALAKVICHADRVLLSRDETDYLYLHDKMTLLLKKEKRSKRTYKLIPFQTKELFFASADSSDFDKKEAGL